jgi:hypothetical protein
MFVDDFTQPNRDRAKDGAKAHRKCPEASFIEFGQGRVDGLITLFTGLEKQEDSGLKNKEDTDLEAFLRTLQDEQAATEDDSPNERTSMSNLKFDRRRMLTLLEEQPWTVEDLSAITASSEKRTREIVAQLWEEGYVTSAETGLLSRLFSIFSRKPGSTKVDFQTVDFQKVSLTLTLKGYLKLHPLISFSSRHG